jgi:uncharacterized repeat protein (TIGR01451 family)
MARTTITLASLFLLAGAIAALLPAQDAAWRKSPPARDGQIVPVAPRTLAPSLRGSAYPINPIADDGGAAASVSDDVGPITAEEGQAQPEESDADTNEAAAEPSEVKSVLKRAAPLPRGAESESAPAEAAAQPGEAATTTPAAPSIRPLGARPLSPITAREARPLNPEPSESSPATEGAPAELPPENTSAAAVPQVPPSARRAGSNRPVGGKLAAAAGQVSGESQFPSVKVQITGPAALTVGKAAKFVVKVTNDGAQSVDEVNVRLPLPAWVSISAAETTGGEAQKQADGTGTPVLLWSLPTLKAKSHDELHLQLIAAEGQPFDLNAEWNCKPPAAQARVQVRQPQLELSIAGPSDLLYGEEKVFTLTASNPGTGDAGSVVVNIATGGNKPKEVAIGNIPAGEQVEIPIQIVANQVGEMQLRATASGEGKLTAEAATKVLIRRAHLAVAVEAPELKFAGTEAEYLVTVTNSGNAAAEDVQVSVAIPSGARYVSGVNGATVTKGNLSWKVGSIPPAAQKQFEIRCQLLVEGTNRVAVQASGKAGLSASGEAATEVEAVSELKLVVNDPSGPAPTGQEVAYEIQVMNRGSRAAKNVKIVMQFGDGVEPTELAGGQGKLVPGQVVCDALPELAAGEQVTLRIKAKGEKAGTHRYRVEVTSGEEDSRLVSEGTSRFFDGKAGSAARTAKKPAKEGTATKQR